MPILDEAFAVNMRTTNRRYLYRHSLCVGTMNRFANAPYFVCFGLAFVFHMSFGGTAIANEAKQVTQAITRVLELSAFVDANVQFCEDRAAAIAPEVNQAAQEWRDANGIAAIGRIRAAFPDGEQAVSQFEAVLIKKRRSEIEARADTRAKSTQWCKNLPKALRMPTIDLRQQMPEALALLERIDQKLKDSEAPATTKQSAPPRVEASSKSVSGDAASLTATAAVTYPMIQQQGIDPKRTVLHDLFQCYARRKGDDYGKPDLSLQFLDDRRYRSNGGEGRYRIEFDDEKFVFENGPLESARGVALAYNDYGQRFSLLGVRLGGPRKFVCYQQGARAQQAITAFRLVDPQPGNYVCRDTEGRSLGKLVLGDNDYSINGKPGTYSVDLRSHRKPRSRIDWLSGPLKGQRASFQEEPGTGYRTLRLRITANKLVANAFTGAVVAGGGKKVTAVCTSRGEALVPLRFGKERAPELPADAGGLSGFFVLKQSAVTGMRKRPSHYQFYTFFPNGYVYLEEPEADPAEVDCSRTKPNGAPLCDRYTLEGNRITIGDREPQRFRLNGDTLVIGKHEGFRVAPARDRLDGHFWANAGETTGVCGPFGACSSWYEAREFLFRPDGTFTRKTEGKSTSSLESAIGSTYAGGSKSDADAGRYRITGNVIELSYNDGYTSRAFIMVVDATRFHMGGWTYTPK